jgi:hypothetical protein
MSETNTHRCTKEITRDACNAWWFRGIAIEYCPLCGVHLDTLERLQLRALDAVLTELAESGVMTRVTKPLRKATR